MRSELIKNAWDRDDFDQLISIRRSMKDKDLLSLHYVELLFLGVAAAARQRYKLALPCFWFAHQKNPKNPDVCLNLANCLKDLGDYPAARDIYTSIDNFDQDYLAQLGAAICDMELGKNLDAYNRLSKLFASYPDDPDVRYNYGRVSFRLERIEDAIEAYKGALERRPGFEAAATNLAIAFLKNRDINSGYAMAEQVLRSERQTESFLVSLITTSLEAGAPDIGLAFFKKNTKKFSPHLDFVAAESSRYMRDPRAAVKLLRGVLNREKQHLAASVVCMQSLSDLGRFDEAARLRVQRYDKISLNEVTGRTMPNPWALFAIEADAQKLCDAANLYANNTYNQLPRELVRISGSKAELAVGFHSPDFANHPVAECILPVFQESWGGVRKIAFSTRAEHDQMSSRISEAVDEFIECRNLNIIELRKLISERSIPIMVDLAVYTNGGRPSQFALGLAPKQVNYLGYSGSSGASAYDFIIGDEFITPKEASHCYSEKIINLDVPLLSCSLRDHSSITPMCRSEYELPEGAVVFGCLAQFYKINANVLMCWSEILKGVHNSVLLLSQAEEKVQTSIRTQFSRLGIQGNRVFFGRREPSREEHIARLKVVDVFLDTFPYNAHSLAADALSAGVPVVTLALSTFASRVAGSLLTGLECNDLVTDSEKLYVERAVELGKNQTLREQARKRVVDSVRTGGWARRYAKSLSDQLVRINS